MYAPENFLKRLLDAGLVTQDQIQSTPTNALRQLMMPGDSGGFVRREDGEDDPGQTIALNGQPGGAYDALPQPPRPQAGGAYPDQPSRVMDRAMPSQQDSQAFAPPQQQSRGQVPIKMAGYSNDGIMSDLGNTMGPAPQLDMSRPQVDTPKGRGYYGKDGAVYVLGPDGYTKIVMGYDQRASMAQNKADLERRKGEADITHTQAATAELSAPHYQMTPDGEAFDTKTGMVMPSGSASSQVDRKMKTAAYDNGLKELQKDDAAAASTNQLEAALNRWAELQPNVTTGRIMGNVPAIGQPDRQELIQLQNYLSMNNFKPGQGSMSNMERGLIKAGGPNVNNDAETNLDAIRVMKGGVQNMRDRDQFRQAYLQAKGSLLGSDAAWQQYIDANPRYVSDPATKRLVDNPSRADWQGYFGGSSAAAPAPSSSVAAPQEAIAYLKQNPGMKVAFDMKYGQGAAAKVLGR